LFIVKVDICFLALPPTLSVGDVAVEFSRTFGKSTKAWLITKVCLDAFTRHIVT
jgi:hypothetical protein